jgi:hypothetical protein
MVLGLLVGGLVALLSSVAETKRVHAEICSGCSTYINCSTQNEAPDAVEVVTGQASCSGAYVRPEYTQQQITRNHVNDGDCLRSRLKVTTVSSGVCGLLTLCKPTGPAERCWKESPGPAYHNEAIWFKLTGTASSYKWLLMEVTDGSGNQCALTAANIPANTITPCTGDCSNTTECPS